MAAKETHHTLTDGKLLAPYLHQILNHIKISDEEAKENVKVMNDTVDALLKAMREDPLFNEIFQKLVYTGSYYEGLRIKEPNEFDLNLVLSLPIKSEDLEIQRLPDYDSFAKYRLKKKITDLFAKHQKWNIYQHLEKLFDEHSRFLCLDKVQNWLHSIVIKAKNSPKFIRPCSILNVDFRKGGPAVNMIILKNNGDVIDVDLVFCINGPTKKWPKKTYNSPRIQKANLTPQQRTWYLIPKVFQDGESQNTEPDYTLWKISLPEAEKVLIRNIGCGKELIRILKCLRDEQKWKNIASYHLKSFIIMEIDLNPSPSYWHPENKGQLFIKMLEKLQKIINTKKLPNYFYRGNNLLGLLSQKEAANIANRINSILKDIDKNPKNILKHFGISEEDKSRSEETYVDSNIEAGNQILCNDII